MEFYLKLRVNTFIKKLNIIYFKIIKFINDYQNNLKNDNLFLDQLYLNFHCYQY